ncbi:MAG: carbohydrate ABC transporter permease [Christensenellales bacterium]
MKNRAFSTYAVLTLRLFPLLFLPVFLIQALNPAAFLPQISGWSYPYFLSHAMEVDTAFSAAFKGIREMFASNAILTFCGFAATLMMAVMALCLALSFFGEEKARRLALRVAAVAAGILAGLSLLMLLSVLGANATIGRKGYRELGMRYLYPAGCFYLLGVSAAFLALYTALRRSRRREEGRLVTMTRNEVRENLKGYAFISPYLIGFLLFIAYPMLFSLFSSFTYYNITAVQKWYGVTNYLSLFTGDDMFWKSLGNTMYYVVFSVPLVIIMAMLLALLMNMRVRFMSFFRTVYYLPSVLSGVAVFLLWQWIFDPNSGLLNNGLAILGIRGPAWLYDATWTKPALIVMRLWSTGGTMVLLLAALQGVPGELYEAGAIDGAVKWKKFRYITLPMISPTLFFVMVTGISSAFQVYDSAYIMVENGGPDKSLMFYNLYLFTTAFKDQSMGKASAMAWFLFFVIMVFTLIQMAASKRWVYYEGGTDK